MTKISNKTKYLILGSLTIQPFSGYEIKKFISESISHFWAESNGQIYPALIQLLKDGWVQFHKKKVTGKKESHIYAITALGRHHLEKWLEFPADAMEKDVQRDEGLLKLFFGSNVSYEESLKRLRKREKSTAEKLQTYLEIKKEIETMRDSPNFLFWQLTLENGILHARSELMWCCKSIKMIEGRKK